MQPNKNPIQQRIEEERLKKNLTKKEVDRLVGNYARAEGVRINADKISQNSTEMWQRTGHKEKRQATLMATNQLPEVKQRRSASAAAMFDNPEYYQEHCERMQALAKDPEYIKKNREGYLKAKEDSQYWENYYKGIERRDADPEYHKKRIEASNAKICKRVHTPLGEFDSQTLAAKAHGLSNSETIRHRIKSPNFPDYYLI